MTLFRIVPKTTVFGTIKHHQKSIISKRHVFLSFGTANWCVINPLGCGASRNRTTDTWIFSTMLYTEYQALTGISDQIETISVSQFVPVCPVMPTLLLQLGGSVTLIRR